MDSHFNEAVSPHTCNCTKEDVITGPFQCLFQYICSLFHFNRNFRRFNKYRNDTNGCNINSNNNGDNDNDNNANIDNKNKNTDNGNIHFCNS